MMAILTTAGPVSTYRAVQYTRKSLHCIFRQQFVKAATELHKNNLGALVKLDGKGCRTNVFIKKPPDEVGEALYPYIDLDVMQKHTETDTNSLHQNQFRSHFVPNLWQLGLCPKNCLFNKLIF